MIGGEFHDRRTELEFYRKKLEALKTGEMIILYGRRRLGKTLLIEKFLESSRKECRALYLYINVQGEAELKEAVVRDIGQQWQE
ncbi:MAG: hypothetical protein Q7T16_02300, partial [Candidatus Burarchaeum sp.]